MCQTVIPLKRIRISGETLRGGKFEKYTLGSKILDYRENFARKMKLCLLIFSI